MNHEYAQTQVAPPWAADGAKMVRPTSSDQANLPVLMQMLNDILTTGDNEVYRLERSIDRLVLPRLEPNKAPSFPEATPLDNNNLSVALGRMIDAFRVQQSRVINCNNRLQEFIGE